MDLPAEWTRESISIGQRLRAFVLKSEGRWSYQDLANFSQRLEKRGITLNLTQLETDLSIAAKGLLESEASIFVCTSGACRRSQLLQSTWDQLHECFDHQQIEATICQWACETPPVVSVRTQGNLIRHGSCTLDQIRGFKELVKCT